MKLRLEFECGEKACAVVPGRFCRFLRCSLDGKSSCELFGCRLDEEDGWVQRWRECLELPVVVEAPPPCPKCGGTRHVTNESYEADPTGLRGGLVPCPDCKGGER